jgi:hypothetical protein
MSPHLHFLRVSQERKQHAAGGKQCSLRSALLAICFMLVSWLAYLSTLKLEAARSAEEMVGSHRTTRRYIPEDRDLQIDFTP